jgi:hypothetical protein
VVPVPGTTDHPSRPMWRGRGERRWPGGGAGGVGGGLAWCQVPGLVEAGFSPVGGLPGGLDGVV